MNAELLKDLIVENMRKVHQHMQECILQCEIRVSGKFLSLSRASNAKPIAACILTSLSVCGKCYKNLFAISPPYFLILCNKCDGWKGKRRTKFLLLFGRVTVSLLEVSFLDYLCYS